MRQRLAVIVPYRDRADHLREFVPALKWWLDHFLACDYTIEFPP